MSNETNGDLKEITSTTGQDSSYFSDFVTVISGARQTANQEFNRFWEKFGFNKSDYGTTYTPTSSSSNSQKMMPYNKTQQSFISTNRGDLIRMRKGQDIYGRIIPDTNRRGYIKDAEIQTDVVTIEEEGKGEVSVITTQKSPTVSLYTAEQPVSAYTNKRKASTRLDDILSRPQKMIKTDCFTSPKISSPVRVTTAPETISAASSKQQRYETRDLDITAVRQSPTSTRHLISCLSSPERNIVTGSTKSVKRLASELEGVLSPRFPSASPKRLRHTSTSTTTASMNDTINGATASSSNSNQDPFFSTPLNKTSPLSETNSLKKASPQPSLISNPSLQSKSLFSEDEEEERMAQIAREVVSIKSQMQVLVTDPSDESPIPSDTVSSIVSRIEPLELPTHTTKPPSPVTRFNTLSLFTSSMISSPSWKINGTISSVAPPPPPIPPKSFSPNRDFPPIKYQSPKERYSSYTATRDEHEKKSSLTNGIKPNDKHKENMRELIQLIPGVRLRKTDKIIGPDGTERPNPFWNEIYNPGKRRVC